MVLLPFEPPPPLLAFPPPVLPLDVALFDDPPSVEAVVLPPPPQAATDANSVALNTILANFICALSNKFVDVDGTRVQAFNIILDC